MTRIYAPYPVGSQPIRTTDARMRTTDPAPPHPMVYKPRGKFRFHDTVISAETGAHNPEMMGRKWVGDFIAQLGKLDSTDRTLAIYEAQEELKTYARGNNSSGAMGRGPANSLSTAPRDPSRTRFDREAERSITSGGPRPEKMFDASTTATPDDINGINALVSDRSGLGIAAARAALTRDVARHSGGITPADLQAIHDRFNAIGRKKQEAARGREWGKG